MNRREFIGLLAAAAALQRLGESRAAAAPGGARPSADLARRGRFEAYKSSHTFDSTHKHPEWLGKS